MSSYIDHHAEPEAGVDSREVIFSWSDFTARRLSWLYGPDYAVTRQPMTAADLAAWNALGSRRAA